MTKKIKTTLLTATVTAVLCAGTISARQLYRPAQSTVCRNFCTKKTTCPNVLGCACVIQPGFTSGTCQLIAAKPR
ncbi:MAG TPA: hypothetical protein VG488_10175 [Candidatus Angelobacter sp.]|jgi:hypothetical protein|nr:hypothetical protein [Candidatus Angelobacter sp.]